MDTRTGYARTNSTQGSKVKVFTTIMPSRIIRVTVDCPTCGKVSENHEGTGRVLAEVCADNARQAHANHTKVR